MARTPSRDNPLPAAVVDTVVELGRHIALARARRRWPQEELAAKAGISPVTLRRIESGAPGTGIGAYAAVLWVLGLHDQLAEVAGPGRDPEGEALEVARLGERVRPERASRLDDDF